MAKYDNSVVSARTPRMGNVVTRSIGGGILRLLGWKITGQLPNVNKVVFIGAPHTSNWDFVIAMAAILSVGLRCSWMMKKEAFFWPLGGLWKAMGGVPIDRKANHDVTTQMSDWFAKNETAWLGLTPEGTRTKVTRFKQGYLRIAYAAQVPVFVVGIHGPTKEIILDRMWPLTGDIEADNAAIMAYYAKTFVGVRPENGLENG